MVEVIVRRTERLSGEVYAPPSKAYTQRMLIAALLSHGTSKISNPLASDDTQVTLRAIKAFGAKVKRKKGYWTIEGEASLKNSETPVDCGESGATLRFMIPVAALAPSYSVFAQGRALGKRPIEPLLRSLRQLGVTSSLQQTEGGSFIRVQGGGIQGGKTTIRGDISSQFISGLMFACPRARTDTEIVLATLLESKGYVQMTKEILDKHGIQVLISEDFGQLQIPSNQMYRPCDHEVAGDFSSAAFLLAAAAITGSKILVKDLDYDTEQGDKIIVDILEKMGLKAKVGNDQIEVEGQGTLDSLDVDAKDIPDLVPVCTVLACYSKGTSKIFNACRLRYKESDRLSSLYVELRKMGAEIVMNEDGFMIKGPCALHGSTIDAHNDHRIAMACAIAALGAKGKTRIRGSECVKKSYPAFFVDLRSLGADVVGGQFDR